MLRAILFQVVATIIAAAVAGLLKGAPGAISAIVGGMCCVLPNGLFALRLRSINTRPGASYPLNFFLGEIIKIVATVSLLYLVGKNFADLHWPSMLIGLGLALQAGFLAFLKKS